MSSNPSRPPTALSRPPTARPQTAMSSRREASYVLAVLEGRGVGREVGIAALDKETARVNLIQVDVVPATSESPEFLTSFF